LVTQRRSHLEDTVMEWAEIDSDWGDVALKFEVNTKSFNKAIIKNSTWPTSPPYSIMDADARATSMSSASCYSLMSP
jgi:hypothetical protein